jgi:hypothetical protein
LSLKSAARRLTGAIVTAAGLGLWLWVRGCCRKSLYCLATISWQVCHVGMVPTPDAKRSPAGPQNGRKQCAQPRTFAKTARRYNICAETEARPLYPQGLGLPRIISPFAASSGWHALRVSDFAQTAAVQAGIVLPNRGRPPLACVVVAGVGAAVIDRLQLW